MLWRVTGVATFTSMPGWDSRRSSAPITAAKWPGFFVRAEITSVDPSSGREMRSMNGPNVSRNEAVSKSPGRRHRDFESLLGGRLDELPDIRTLEGVSTREDDAPCCTGGDPGDDGERGFGVNWVDTLGTPAVGALLAALRRHMEVERLDASHHNPFRCRPPPPVSQNRVPRVLDLLYGVRQPAERLAPRTQGSRPYMRRRQPAESAILAVRRSRSTRRRQSDQPRIRPSSAVAIPQRRAASTLSGVSVDAWKSVSSISSTCSVVNASAGRPCMANIA